MGADVIERVARRLWVGRMTRVRPTSRVRQRQRRIASAVCLVQRVSGRRLRELSHHNKAIRVAHLHGGVIGAEVGGAIEAASCETALQLLSRPTSHHELVVENPATEDVAAAERSAVVHNKGGPFHVGQPLTTCKADNQSSLSAGGR